MHHPGGTDMQLVQPDGLIDLTARHTIEAADGTLIRFFVVR